MRCMALASTRPIVHSASNYLGVLTSGMIKDGDEYTRSLSGTGSPSGPTGATPGATKSAEIRRAFRVAPSKLLIPWYSEQTTPLAGRRGKATTHPDPGYQLHYE